MFQPVVMMIALGLSTVANGQKFQPATALPVKVKGADDVVKSLETYRIGRQTVEFRALAATGQQQLQKGYKFRNIAAEDAAGAVRDYCTRMNKDFCISVENRSNMMLLSGDPADVKHIVAMIATLDVTPPLVMVHMTIFEAPANFADDVGLGDGQRWVLTPREAKMLAASIHSRHGKEVDIVSRPQLLLTENQQGFFQASDGDSAHVVRITPRIMPDGASHLLRFEAEQAKQTLPGVQNTTAISTTETLPISNTLFLRGGCTKVGDKMRCVFYVVIVHKVVNADR